MSSSADGGGVIRRHHIEHAVRHAGALGDLGERDGRERRQLGRLHHHRAAGGQRRAGLAGDHGGGEVPGRDRGGDADRLLEHENTLVARLLRHHIAIDASALLREPIEVGGAIGDLAARLGERLALLGGDDLREALLLGEQQIMQRRMICARSLASLAAPGGQGALGGVDRAARFGRAHVGTSAKSCAGRRIANGEGRAIVGADEGAVDEGLLAERAGLSGHLGCAPDALRKGPSNTAPSPADTISASRKLLRATPTAVALPENRRFPTYPARSRQAEPGPALRVIGEATAISYGFVRKIRHNRGNSRRRCARVRPPLEMRETTLAEPAIFFP